MDNAKTAAAAAEQIMEGTQALLAATAHIAGDKMTIARNRLASALHTGKEKYCVVQDKAVAKVKAGAKATDETIREYPYQALGLALGLGAVLGIFLAKYRER